MNYLTFGAVFTTPLPRRPEDMASHVTVTNPPEQRDKGGGAVGAAGEEGGDE